VTGSLRLGLSLVAYGEWLTEVGDILEDTEHRLPQRNVTIAVV